jgi:steroid 5-alpha reductase family enzyme
VVHLGTSWIGPAGIAWALLAVIWLILSWREPRGRAWHQVLAVAPLAAFATALWGPAGVAEPVALWLLIGGGVLAALVLAWAWGVAARNHGVMDVIYPLTVLAGALVAAWCVGFEQWIMFALAPIAIWSIRLAVQTYGHNMGSEREPYASWRKRFGAKWLWWSAFQIHLLQGVTVWIWCAPLAFAFAAPEPRPLWPLVVGAAIWLAGFALQT